MKKFLFPVLSAGAFFALTSCSADDPNVQPNDGSVTFSVNLPEISTRAFGDLETLDCNELKYTVYDAAGENVIIPTETVQAFGPAVTTANLNLKLVTNESYKIVFYAHNNTSEFSSYENGVISVDYSKANINSEVDDAFYQVMDFTVDGLSKTVTLSRPFAQVNIGTDDLDETTVKNIISHIRTNFSVASGLYSSFDLIKNEVTSEVTDATRLATTKAPEVNTDFPVEGYSNLLSTYLLVPTTQTLLNSSYDINNGTNLIRSLNLDNLPVRMNYRTNIYGSLITTNQPFNIVIEEAFETPDYVNVVEPSTAEDLSNAFASPVAKEININEDLDASSLTQEDLTLTSPKTINIAEGKTLTLPYNAFIETSQDLTINGGSIVSNLPASTRAEGEDPMKGKSISMIHVYGGTLTVKNTTLELDMNHHWHGPNYNTAAIAYWNDANIIIENSTIKSGEFTVCGMGRGVNSATVTIKDSYFESTSANSNNGENWAYTLRLFGSTGTMTNCTVKAIQGAVSAEEIDLTIDGGLYYTYNTPGKTNAFYPVYVTNRAHVTILAGYFYGANKHNALAGDGKSCIVCGDNDVNLPAGYIDIKGGYFNGKAYNTSTESVYDFDYKDVDVTYEGLTFTYQVGA